jgi:hypothetical protein
MEPVTKNLPIEKKPKLLDHVREAMRTKHYSLKTEEADVHWIKRLIFFRRKKYGNLLPAIFKLGDWQRELLIKKNEKMSLSQFSRSYF